MKYIVKEFDGDDKLRYAVIETLKYSGLRKDFSDIYHGIILVVDDNKTNLAVVKNELSKKYQVTPVISGLQALKFLEKKIANKIYYLVYYIIKVFFKQ